MGYYFYEQHLKAAQFPRRKPQRKEVVRVRENPSKQHEDRTEDSWTSAASSSLCPAYIDVSV